MVQGWILVLCGVFPRHAIAVAVSLTSSPMVWWGCMSGPEQRRQLVLGGAILDQLLRELILLPRGLVMSAEAEVRGQSQSHTRDRD